MRRGVHSNTHCSRIFTQMLNKPQTTRHNDGMACSKMKNIKDIYNN